MDDTKRRIRGEMMVKSEFGRGLVICLVKFAEHFENYQHREILQFNEYLKQEDVTDKKFVWWMEKIVPIYKDTKRALSSNIGTFMNGASDHLYEIEVPKGREWDGIRIEVKKLQDKGLEMGHGFLTPSVWTVEDLREVKNMTRKISLMIDRRIGLSPNEGSW